MLTTARHPSAPEQVREHLGGRSTVVLWRL